MEDEKIILSLANASVGFRHKKLVKVLLENLDLEVKTGELTCLVGRNGSGKSTLLRCIANLHHLLSGEVVFKGMALENLHPVQFAQNIAYVSSVLEYTQTMTVNELVSLGRFPYTNWIGRLSQEDKYLVEQAMDNVGIDQLSSRKLNEISDGERQKAMIARTLAQDTQLIIFDEPTSFLDLPSKYDIISLFYELRNKGKTIIYSTHDLNIAMRFSDSMWLIGEKCIHQGAPEDLMLMNTIAAVFESGKIQLNEMTGDFEMRKSFSKKLCLECNFPIVGQWTRQALQRSGFEIVEYRSDLPLVKVEQLNGKIIWKIQRFNENLIFESIYDMISSLTII